MRFGCAMGVFPVARPNPPFLATMVPLFSQPGM
jgi:hypothetical protein